MAKISLILILILQARASFAQNYFVFIGSEDRQAFYVRVDSEFHSSSPEGHLILSQLKDSTYNITVGFPGQTLPEQHYRFDIGGKDQEFQLQPQGQDGLRLYDLQGKDWLSLQGGAGRGDEFRTTGVKKDDAFSRMMAGVVHDTAVLYNTYAMEQTLSDSVKATASTTTPSVATTPGTTTTRRDTTVATGARPDSAIATTTSPDSPMATIRTDSTRSTTTRSDTSTSSSVAVTDTTVGATPLYRPIPAKDSSKTTAAVPIPATVGSALYRPVTRVTKVSEHRTSRNLRLVYADHSGGEKADTIVVIIPIDSPVAGKTPKKNADSTRIPAARPHGPNPDSPTVSATGRPIVPVKQPETPKPHLVDTPAKPAKPATVFINSDCHDFATDFDADKLRAKMLQTAKEEDRLNIARKAFKGKCFHTDQVRTLSEVFASQAAKFRFLEAAWPFAADEHFHELSDLLTDPVYNSKFKTMTHTQ